MEEKQTNLSSLSDEGIPIPIPIELWGKDHWSVLAYVEARCVNTTDGIGKPDPRNIQTNHHRHPFMGNLTDGSQYSIRLKGGKTLPGPDYDEWDVLDDLEHFGLIENVGSGINRAYRMQPLGNDLVGQLRTYKTQGGDYADFCPVVREVA